MRLLLFAAIFCTSISLSQTIVFSEDFETGSLNSFTAGGVVTSLTWQATTNRGSDPGHSASYSAYFGNPTTFNFNTGSTEGAYITTGGISLSGANESFILSFNYFLETEGSLLSYDQVYVEISTNGITYTKLFGNGLVKYNTNGWQSVKYDLSSYAGSTVYIRIRFNSVDSGANNYEGFYVDDVKITSLASSVAVKTFGTNGSESVTYAQSALDGGVVITGGVYAGDQQYYALHLDENLNVVSSVKGGRSGESDAGYGVSQSKLGGYVLTGELYAGPIGDADQFVSRIGSANIPSWLRAHGSIEWCYAKRMQELSDNSIILGGTDNSQIYLTMVNYAGYPSWTRRINLNTYEYVIDIQQRSNGDIWVLFRDGDEFGEQRYGIWSISTTGTTNWMRLYDSNGQENPSRLYIDESGDAFIVGYTSAAGAGNYDVSLTKVNYLGYVYWSKVYGGSNSDEGVSVARTVDGGLIVGLTTNSFGAGDDDMSLMKLDASGNLKWAKTYGGIDSDHASFVKTLGNGDNILVGSTSSFGSGSSDILAFKTDSTGATDGCYNTAFFSQGSYSLTVSTVSPNTTGTNTYSTVTITSGANSFSSTNPVPNASFTVTDPLCNGDNGSIDLTLTGGAFPYSYQWSTGGTSEDVLAAPAGSHYVQITDAKGCFVKRNVDVTEPTEVNTTISGTNIDCYGDQDGSVDLTVSGGTAPYTYSWTNGANTQDLSGLSGGFYQVTVSDDNNCETVAAISISEPLPVVAAISGVTNVSCYNECNGSLTVTSSGGTAPYNYQWNDQNSQTTQTANGLCVGNYLVTIADNHGCTTIASSVVTQPTELHAQITTTNAECQQSNGAGSATASGGTGTYSFLWTDNGSIVNIGASVSGLNPGSGYALQVIDGNGCEDTVNFSIGTFVQQQPICVITVDNQNHNVVVWEKPAQTGIKGFNIYRDVSGTYIPVGYVAYDSLSQFVDLNPSVNPNVTSYRYKVSMLDSCGNESPLSPFHETMHLTTNVGTGGAINLIWDTYEGFGYNNYRILRDSTGTGNWEVLDSVSNFSFTYTDLNPPTSGAEYVMEVVAPSTCTSSRANHNTTRSNKSAPISGGGGGGTIIAEYDLSSKINVYPNPNRGEFTYEFVLPADMEGIIEITDARGRTITSFNVSLTRGINRVPVNIGIVERGMYLINLRAGQYYATNRLGIIR